jgi:predicted XRE-type DNA-binding protein
MIIYKAQHKTSGKVYIGKTVLPLDKRKAKHKYEALQKDTSYKFHRAIRKYGVLSFDWTIVDTAETTEELTEKEIYYIALYDSVNKGYNTTTGGEGMAGFNHTEESKAKISANRKGLALGESSPNARLTETEVIQIKQLLVQGLSQRKIAAQFNVSKGTIANIQRGQTWAHVEVEGFTPAIRDQAFVCGGKNVRATVSEDTVRAIKRDLATGSFKQKEIAVKYNVTEQYVSQIKNNKIWSHIEGVK